MPPSRKLCFLRGISKLKYYLRKCNPMNLINKIYMCLNSNFSKINYKLMPTYEAFLSINPFNSKFWRSQSFDFLEKAK